MEQKEKQITCGNKTDCNSIIKKTEPYIRIENRYFCCRDCVGAFLKQEAKFAYARDSHRKKRILEYFQSRKEVSDEPIQLEMQLDD